MSNEQHDAAKAALQKAGFRAWFRPPSEDASSGWGAHIHDVSDPNQREALRDWLRCTCRETPDPECLRHGD